MATKVKPDPRKGKQESIVVLAASTADEHYLVLSEQIPEFLKLHSSVRASDSSCLNGSILQQHVWVFHGAAHQWEMLDKLLNDEGRMYVS